jgi:hypothetical protein
LLRIRIKRIAVLTLLLALMAAGQGRRPSYDVIGPLSHIQPPSGVYSFPDGVTYVYAADWRIWPAGTATLRLERSGNGQRAVATVDSTGFVALLYRVQDRFESRFDPLTFCSQQINKHTEEGLRRRQTDIRFDYGHRKSILEETNLRDNQKRRSEAEIPGCVTDVLSGIYYVASLPLQVGATYVFPLNDGGRTVDVHLAVEGREQIKTDAGTFSTLRVRPDASAGVLKDRGKAWIWYSDDAQRIPVQIQARLFWGPLTLKLQRIERQ